MLKSKVTLAVGSVMGIFIVVYGTALLLGLLFDAYLFEGGLTNLNYGLLALLCTFPFAVISVVGKNNRALIIAALMFSVLFVLVHLVLVLSAEVMDASRVVTIFPVSALVLAVVLYFTAGKEKLVQ